MAASCCASEEGLSVQGRCKSSPSPASLASLRLSRDSCRERPPGNHISWESHSNNDDHHQSTTSTSGSHNKNNQHNAQTKKIKNSQRIQRNNGRIFFNKSNKNNGKKITWAIKYHLFRSVLKMQATFYVVVDAISVMLTRFRHRTENHLHAPVAAWARPLCGLRLVARSERGSEAQCCRSNASGTRPPCGITPAPKTFA